MTIDYSEIRRGFYTALPLYPKYSGQYPVRKGGDTAAPVMELCNIVQGDTKAVSVIVLYGIDIAYLLKVVKILNYSQV